MYQTINEKIQVLVSFNDEKIFPLFFKWGKKKYRIEKVNLIHVTRLGKDVIYYFNVSDMVNYFKLRFNPAKLEWWLEEIYSAG